MGDYSLDSCWTEEPTIVICQLHFYYYWDYIIVVGHFTCEYVPHGHYYNYTNNNITSRNFETWVQKYNTHCKLYICTPVDLHEAKVSYLVIP